jgi:multidrug resistance efflux pump
MKKNRFGILIMAVLVVLAIGLAVLGPMIFRRESPKESPEVKGTLGASLAAKGIVESEEKIVIGSLVAGKVKNMAVNEGDMVKKGERLVTLDESELTAKIRIAAAALDDAKSHLKELEHGYRGEDIEMAGSRVKRSEAAYANAHDEFERQKRLYDKNATTAVEFDRARERRDITAQEVNEAQANLTKLEKGPRPEEIEGARAMVRKAAAELAYSRALLPDYNILSPIDGVVAERFKDADETVDVGTPIVEVVNPLKLRIHAELEETDVGKVKVGQEVEVYPDAYKDKAYHGKVYSVFSVVRRKAQRTFDPAASFDVNTQGMYIMLDNFTGLKDGMTVTVRFLR